MLAGVQLVVVQGNRILVAETCGGAPSPRKRSGVQRLPHRSYAVKELASYITQDIWLSRISLTLTNIDQY